MKSRANSIFPTKLTALSLFAPLLIPAVLSIAACNRTASESESNMAAASSVNAGSTAPTTTIGVKIDDSVITTKVKSALLADDYVKSMDVKVETRKSVVMLSGFADNQAQIDRAMMVAGTVEGVTSVDNQLSIKSGKESIGNKIDDTVITASVKSALLAEASLKSNDISVVTQGGEVQLSGFVENASQLKNAIDVTKKVDGVKKVIDHMTIKK
jgi:hyperosmotically inducible protein